MQHRQETDENQFFIPFSKLSSEGPLTIIGRKGRLGVAKGAIVTVPTLYDEVRIITLDLCALRVEKLWAMADPQTGDRITPFRYSDIGLEQYGSVPVTSRDGGKGIFDCDRRRESVAPEYDETSMAPGTEYVWVRRNGTFGFTERATGRYIPAGGLIKPYDTPEGMIGLNELGRVMAFTSGGYESPSLLRMMVMDAGGHLALRNYSLHDEDIIDVYGNIVNV